MSQNNHIDWKGQSGAVYRYWFLAKMSADTIKSEAGNYVFVEKLANGNFSPLYFGESENLSDRLPGHEVWPEAKRLGARYVMAHTKPAGETARLAEEKDLIQFWNPQLNKEHRSVG